MQTPCKCTFSLIRKKSQLERLSVAVFNDKLKKIENQLIYVHQNLIILDSDNVRINILFGQKICS